ncbi:hypothetical protein C1646_774122 [Rhizophagus diaphanus]|nr:hypothetical protein C1646_774122 [Rhizophagus diaphanus] [Rhizophagus sp. MUCL 43196]
MQSEIDETDSLKICIARLEVENAELRKKFAEIEARNAELKAKIAKLEDKQLQNEMHIIDRLPESLVKRACERLLHHSKDPVLLESISRKSERIESYLRYTLESECNVFPTSPAIYVIDIGVQTNSTWPKALNHDYEEENNRRVINELKVLSQYLVDYNKRTFGKFMEDIEKDYKERVNMNKKL